MVIRSVEDRPVSDSSFSVTFGAIVSRVNVSDAVPTFPAKSLSLATSVWTPLTSPLGEKLQMPELFAVTVPSSVPPSLMVTWRRHPPCRSRSTST